MHHPVTAFARRHLTHAERCAQLRDLHAALRRCLDGAPGAPGADGSTTGDLRARIAACEADLMEDLFENMPI